MCDLIAKRRNDRDLRTDRGITVANRHTFEIINTDDNGSINAQGKTGTVELPAEYVRAHVQLASATTAHGAQIMQRQTIDIPATSVLRNPATAVKQTATVQPAMMQPVERPPVEAKTLKPEHLRRFLEEQRTLTAEIRMPPNRVGDAARQVDRLAPKVQRLEQAANSHRDVITEQQKLLDGHEEGGMLHRARHNKTMERLETSILHEQQKLSFVQKDLNTITPALQLHTASLHDLQARQQVVPQQLSKIPVHRRI